MKKTLIALTLSIISINSNASSLVNEESLSSASSVIEGINPSSIFQAENLGSGNHYIRGFDGTGALIFSSSNSAVFFGNYNQANIISGKDQKINPITKLNQKGNAEIFENLKGLYAKKTSAKEKEEVVVLVDPKCGYCYKLHSEEQQYLDNGYSLLYVPYPVLDNQSYGVITSKQGLEYVFSAESNEEKVKRLDDVMKFLKENPRLRELPETYISKITDEGKSIVQKSVETLIPLAATGTPGLLNKNGVFIGGYIPATHLDQAILKQKQ